MKTVFSLLFLLIFSHTFTYSQTANLDCNQLRSAIVVAKKTINDYRADKLRESYPSYSLDELGVVESRNDSLERFEEFKILQNYIKIQKENCLSCFGGKAPNPVDMALFFKASEILSREEYIRFANATADLVENGAISKMQYRWVLVPFSKHLRDMWAEDPISKPLQELALRAKTVMADDSGFQDFLSEKLLRKLAAPGALRQTIPPLDDGSAPFNTTNSPSHPTREPTDGSIIDLTKHAESFSTTRWLIIIVSFVGLGSLIFFFKKRRYF